LFAFSTEMLPLHSRPDSSSSSSETKQSDAAAAATTAAAAAGALETGYILQATGRYSHSAGYLRQVAIETGWRLVLLQGAVTIRYNAGQPILGNLCVLQRCA
jgi:predicted TPR repeat methyltransferase